MLFSDIVVSVAFTICSTTALVLWGFSQTNKHPSKLPHIVDYSEIPLRRNFGNFSLLYAVGHRFAFVISTSSPAVARVADRTAP